MAQIWSLVLSYLLWIISTALGILIMLKSLELLSSVFGLISGNRWVHSALDRFGVLILGLMCLVFVLFCEHYYQQGASENKLWRRFGLITAVELSLLILAGIVPPLIS